MNASTVKHKFIHFFFTLAIVTLSSQSYAGFAVHTPTQKASLPLAHIPPLQLELNTNNGILTVSDNTFLYMLVARSGEHDNHNLRLFHIPLVARYMLNDNSASDTILLTHFIQQLKMRYKNQPSLSARLSIYTHNGTDNYTINLRDPLIVGNDLTFTADNMPTDLPRHFELSAMFIKLDGETA